MKEHIYCAVEVHNLPEKKSHGFMVVRRDGKDLWYYGIYGVKQTAEQVAVDIGNGIVLEV